MNHKGNFHAPNTNFMLPGKKYCKYEQQGIEDGSASKPALRQDTGYLIEKTYPDI